MNGRKRHLLVDTMGLVLKAVAHSADVVADRDGARRVMSGLQERYPRIRLVWSDRGYNGALAGWMKEHLGWALKIVKPPRRWVRVPEGEEPPYPKGFIVLPRRRVAERTIAWICRNRRTSRDPEFLAETGEALTYLAMMRLMARRLAKGAA